MEINTRVNIAGRPGGSFYEVFDKQVPFRPDFRPENSVSPGKKVMPTQSGKIMALITSSLWETYFSPPSLFEYMSFTSFMCSLHFLNLEFGGKLKGHKPNGCIFDYTRERKYYRIPMSNPSICQYCASNLRDLESLIHNKTGYWVKLLTAVEKFVSLDWAGSPIERNTPLYNLKKNYKYDVDRNSGFAKSSWEQLKEKVMYSIPDKIVTGLIGVLLGLVIALIANFLPEYSKFLKP